MTMFTNGVIGAFYGGSGLRCDSNDTYIDADKFVLADSDLGVTDGIMSVDVPLSCETEMTYVVTVNESLFKKLTMCEDPEAASYTLICRCPYMIPKRRHKKKRINKKWAKRYGYVTKFKNVKLEDVNFDNSNERVAILGTLSKGEFYYD